MKFLGYSDITNRFLPFQSLNTDTVKNLQLPIPGLPAFWHYCFWYQFNRYWCIPINNWSLLKIWCYKSRLCELMYFFMLRRALQAQKQAHVKDVMQQAKTLQTAMSVSRKALQVCTLHSVDYLVMFSKLRVSSHILDYDKKCLLNINGLREVNI